MSYRGDDEPEYIDDDEYFDPDESGGVRRKHNVLGGSGSWSDDESFDDPPEDVPVIRRAQSNRAPTRRVHKPAAQSSGRSKLKARNPAPSVASSEERRARLAGKKPAGAERESQRRQRNEPPRQQSGDSKDEKRRGLRARFSRADDKADSQSEGHASRVSATISGIGGRIGSLRRRLVRSHDSDTSENRAPAEDGGKGSHSSFPSGRRATPPQSDKSGFNSSAQRLRDGAPQSRSQGANRNPKLASADFFDLDRKLDLFGVALVFGAIVLFLSTLSAEQAAISSVNNIIGQLLGWGAVAIPFAMFALGAWLIVRHFGEDAPTIDPVRLSGVALAFLGLLALFQFIESFNYSDAFSRLDLCRNPANPACVDALVRQSYQAGRGGGLVGGWLYSALVNNLTELGGFVIMLMIMTFSAMLITRSSMAELAIVAIGFGRGLRTELSQYAANRRAARLGMQRQAALMDQTSHVRVSKPRPAQLTSAENDARALPEPSGATLPIPHRLRGLFSLPGRFAAPALRDSLAPKAEAAPVPNAGFLGRFFGKSKDPELESSAPTRRPASSAGPLERFLNLGENLPFSTAESPVWHKPARPKSAQPEGAPRTPASAVEAAQSPPASPAQPIPRPPMSAPPLAKPKETDIPPREDAATTHKPPAHSAFPPPVASAPQPTQELEDAKPKSPPRAATDASGQANKTRIGEGDAGAPIQPRSPAAPSPSSPRPRIDWQLPDYRHLLNRGTEGELDREPLLRQAQIIEDTLASFGAPGRIVEINSGPVITQYGVEPAYLTAKTGKQNRVKVGAIAKLDKDLQLALGANSIRVEAPVPGKGYVGIEVPNPDAVRVSLRDVMESNSYHMIESPLAIALGVSVDGTPISGDLTQMPHLLIAGTTGSGKSVCVNAIINSIIAKNSPDAVKFIMIDPKRVELTGYNGVPHLVAPVVVELEGAIGVLRWVTTEMDARYKKFSRAGARNIVDYNSILDPNLAPMPYIVVIIDELADLMMMAPDDTERAITRIAALARATGIHLVIATQRPSVDVVTGLIKANCPARIAFAVAGSIDSRVILDQPGAERLLGKGDMLYLSGNSPAPLRMQGVHVSNEEINRIIRYWKRQGAGVKGIDPIPLPPLPTARPGAVGSTKSDQLKSTDQPGNQSAFWDMGPARGQAADNAARGANPDEDELYQTAVEMVRRLDKASISLLQRRLRIGYTRAARLMDMLEERRVVGPPKEGSSKPRDVLPE